MVKHKSISAILTGSGGLVNIPLPWGSLYRALLKISNIVFSCSQFIRYFCVKSVLICVKIALGKHTNFLKNSYLIDFYEYNFLDKECQAFSSKRASQIPCTNIAMNK